MRLFVEYDNNNCGDTINVSFEVFNSLDYYLTTFFKWLFDEDNHHEYWIWRDGKQIGCAYTASAFVKWLSEQNIDNSAEVISENTSNSGYPVVML